MLRTKMFKELVAYAKEEKNEEMIGFFKGIKKVNDREVNNAVFRGIIYGVVACGVLGAVMEAKEMKKEETN